MFALIVFALIFIPLMLQVWAVLTANISMACARACGGRFANTFDVFFWIIVPMFVFLYIKG